MTHPHCSPVVTSIIPLCWSLIETIDVLFVDELVGCTLLRPDNNIPEADEEDEEDKKDKEDEEDEVDEEDEEDEKDEEDEEDEADETDDDGDFTFLH